jgi:hypothetical protein
LAYTGKLSALYIVEFLFFKILFVRGGFAFIKTTGASFDSDSLVYYNSLSISINLWQLNEGVKVIDFRIG